MITSDRLNVHPELQELHTKAKCHEGESGCCCNRAPYLKDGACANFVGCGPDVCKLPCRHCIAWEGYGGDEVVNAVKNSAQSA